MRGLGWFLVMVGVLIVVASIFVVAEFERSEQKAAFNIAARGGGYRQPEPTPLWPGLLVGAGASAFGILLLAIRPPEH